MFSAKNKTHPNPNNKIQDPLEWQNHYDAVYGYFYRRINSKFDVEDLTMETLETFYLSDKNIENPHAFLWGIARNKTLEYIRNKGKNQSVELSTWQKNTNSAEILETWIENYRSSEYLAKLERLKECAKNQLSELDIEIVELCVMDDFASKEVAKKLNLSPENTRQRLSRALKKLRDKCRQIWVSVEN